MRILFCGKWPPIQGGVCRESYEFVLSCLRQEHSVTVITNASYVEPGFRAALTDNELSDRVASFGDRFRLLDIGTEKFPTYIPYVPPVMSGLLGAILAEVEVNPPHIIVGSYLEPYGMVALIAASFNNIPTYIRHAGSDLGALATHPLLKKAYSQALIRANGILTHNSNENHELLKALGVKDQLLKNMVSVSKFPSFLSNQRLDIEYYSKITLKHFASPYLTEKTVTHLETINSEEWEDQAPVIGVYGKTGRFKGSFELIQALNELADDKVPFRFLIVLVGWNESISKTIEAIYYSKLRSRTRILPPLPLWRIPEFLSCCDIVAFLENNFPIKSHTPRVPLEVISSSKTLLITREQINRMSLGDVFEHDVNALIVEHPYDAKAIYEALSSALQSPAKMSAIYSRASIVRKLLGFASDKQVSVANDMLATLQNELKLSLSDEPFMSAE